MEPEDAKVQDKELEVLTREEQLKRKRESKGTRKGRRGGSERNDKSKKKKIKKKRTAKKTPVKGRDLLKRAASKGSIKDNKEKDEKESDDEDEEPPRKVRAKAKAKGKAKAKAKAKSSPSSKKTAVKSKAAPKHRLRRKASVVVDESLYSQTIYKQFEDYLANFELCDGGDQFKKLAGYYINFSKLHSTMIPYWTRESCLVKTHKDVTENGKEMTWSFSFFPKEGKGGVYWVWELACSICAAHCMVPGYEKIKMFCF